MFGVYTDSKNSLHFNKTSTFTNALPISASLTADCVATVEGRHRPVLPGWVTFRKIRKRK